MKTWNLLFFLIFCLCAACQKEDPWREKLYNAAEIEKNRGRMVLSEDRKTLLKFTEPCVGAVVVPEGVETIAPGVFWAMPELTAVRLPASFRRFSFPLFSDSPNLADIQVADKNPLYKDLEGVLVTKDGQCMHYYPSAKPGKHYDIPDEVATILPTAICSKYLESISIPERTFSLNAAIFDCPALRVISVDENNIHFKCIDGVLFSKAEDVLGCFPRARGGRYEIPEGTTRIQDGAFYGCKDLLSVTVPDSVVIIGLHVFRECPELVIYASRNSVAHRYAQTVQIPFLDLENNSATEVEDKKVAE